MPGTGGSFRSSTMTTGIFLLIFLIVALLVLDVAALRFGVDSRARDGRPNWW
jgi:hypothetical protein